MNGFTDEQNHALVMTERIASVFSLVGTSFIFITFITSPAFRKPINRLVFYASWGNTLMNVGTLMAQSGIKAGHNSSLCQFQGFLIQMFLPADAFWNLAMATNVYLTLFRKYNASQLKSLEWIYMLVCYGGTFVPAFVYCFIETADRGKIYGSAALWCWVSIKWDFLRVALCYGPAWFCILGCFTIYIMAGREIFKKRNQLRSFKGGPVEPEMIEYLNPFTSYKTTEVHITSELANLPQSNMSQSSIRLDPNDQSMTNHGYEQYTVTIERGPKSPRAKISDISSGRNPSYRQHNAAMDANTAAWAYTKCAILFFVSLLITWVPSSINRAYSLAHPTAVSFPFNYGAGLVLPLMGFWNSVIYITTSWTACKTLFAKRVRPLSLNILPGGVGGNGGFEVMGRAKSLSSSGSRTDPGVKSNGRISLSDSLKGFVDV